MSGDWKMRYPAAVRQAGNGEAEAAVLAPAMANNAHQIDYLKGQSQYGYAAQAALQRVEQTQAQMADRMQVLERKKKYDDCVAKSSGCYRCGGPDHWAQDCPQRSGGGGGGGYNASTSTYVRETWQTRTYGRYY